MQVKGNYLDVCNLAVKCYSMFSDLCNVSVEMVRVFAVHNPPVMDAYLEIMANTQPNDEEKHKQPFSQFAREALNVLMGDVTSTAEYDAIIRMRMKLHHIICESGEECKWHDFEFSRTTLAIDLAKKAMAHKMFEMQKAIEERSGGGIVTINPTNMNAFCEQFVNDIISGFYFEHKMYDADLDINENGEVYFVTGEKSECRITPSKVEVEVDEEWADVIG